MSGFDDPNRKLQFEEVPFSRVEDELSAVIFTAAQKQFLRNQIVRVVNEKVNMPTDTPGYKKKQEYGRGQLDILDFLLESSMTAETHMNAMQGFAPETSNT